MSAVNIDTATPMPSVTANPRIRLDPKYPNINTVISDDRFESLIAFQALLKPSSLDFSCPWPSLTSSLVRSKTRILASTAMPTDRIKPTLEEQTSELHSPS